MESPRPRSRLRTICRGFAPAALVAFLALVPASPAGGGAAAQSSAAPEDAEALAVLERAAARYESLRGFCAEFRQEVDVALLRRTTSSRGRLCQQRPNRFLMRFSEPEGDVVVADGEHLWVYYPSMDPNQVMRSRMAEAPGGLDFHKEFLHEPGEKYAPTYEGMEDLDGAPAHVVSLEPLVPSVITGARLWIDASSWLIRSAEIREENGSVRRVQLSGLQLDPDLPASLFRFTPPAGAQVIQR